MFLRRTCTIVGGRELLGVLHNRVDSDILPQNTQQHASDRPA